MTGLSLNFVGLGRLIGHPKILVTPKLVRYVILPPDQEPRVPAKLIARSGSFRLFGVKTSGSSTGTSSPGSRRVRLASVASSVAVAESDLVLEQPAARAT